MDRPAGTGSKKTIQLEELGGLISSLSRLYAKVSKRLWFSRLNAYHKHSYPHIDIDIQNPLVRHIDSLSEQPKELLSERSGAGQGERPHSDTGLRSSEVYREVILENVPHMLSERFRTARSTGQDAGMGHRLSQSTWDHIHQALRLAREGDDQAAHLHAGFANNALMESAHYLGEEEYGELVAEISAYLEQHPI